MGFRGQRSNADWKGVMTHRDQMTLNDAIFYISTRGFFSKKKYGKLRHYASHASQHSEKHGWKGVTGMTHKRKKMTLMTHNDA